MRAPGKQHEGLREERDERDERHVGRALAVRTKRLLEHGLRPPQELRLLGGLLRKGLHDMDADDVLLGDGRDVGELLLHVAQRRMRDVAVAVRERDEQRRHGEHDQGELPLDEEQNDGHRHDGEQVLEEEDEAVAEEEADALEVDGRARHQLTGLVAVVEAEREADHVRVEAAPHVHLDVERLAAGDEAAAAHERGARDPEADDLEDGDPEAMRVVLEERLVDHVLACHPDERDLRGLRADGEDDRDDEPDAVRAEEAEQANERRAVRNSAHFGRVSTARAAAARRGRARARRRAASGSRAHSASCSPPTDAGAARPARRRARSARRCSP